MCFALGAIGAIASMAGTAASAYGAIAQGKEQGALAEAQARALERQAVANQKASAFEIDKTFREQQRAMSAARAQVGASGVGFQGSPTAVLKANAAETQLDIQAIQWGSKIDAVNMAAQAGISRMQGRAARRNSRLNAAGSIFGGVSSAYSQYSDASRLARLGVAPSEFR